MDAFVGDFHSSCGLELLSGGLSFLPEDLHLALPVRQVSVTDSVCFGLSDMSEFIHF